METIGAPDPEMERIEKLLTAALVEAATSLDEAYVSGPLIQLDGARKYTISGSSEMVSAFLAGYGIARDLVGRYGDPARGFAGGYQK